MNRCPHCAAAVTTTPHDRPILLDADGGPHAATCKQRVRHARVVERRDPVTALIPAAALPREPITVRAKRGR